MSLRLSLLLSALLELFFVSLVLIPMKETHCRCLQTAMLAVLFRRAGRVWYCLHTFFDGGDESC